MPRGASATQLGASARRQRASVSGEHRGISERAGSARRGLFSHARCDAGMSAGVTAGAAEGVEVGLAGVAAAGATGVAAAVVGPWLQWKWRMGTCQQCAGLTSSFSTRGEAILLQLGPKC